jgi:hypothetical protein
MDSNSRATDNKVTANNRADTLNSNNTLKAAPITALTTATSHTANTRVVNTVDPTPTPPAVVPEVPEALVAPAVLTASED